MPPSETAPAPAPSPSPQCCQQPGFGGWYTYCRDSGGVYQLGETTAFGG
ncbi:MAG: hypothetical protein OXU61_04155 [Gammaproteobacteria bacterium]|nr:hypothetical protein [Gammaproteobacteria bacterium]